MEHIPNYNSTADYLKDFINPKIAQKFVKSCVFVLKKKKFDAIAFRGLSGALIAPTIAMQMGKSLIAVRKGENCHTSNTVEGDRAALKYVIVDDFISTGETARSILTAIELWSPGMECIGVLQAWYIHSPNRAAGMLYPELFCTDIVEKWRTQYALEKAEKMRRKVEEMRSESVLEYCNLIDKASAWKETLP